MKEKVNLNKKIFNEYIYIFIAIILIYFFSSEIDLFGGDIFDLFVFVFAPIFAFIAFIINPIRILISYNSEFKTISSKTKRALYYVVTIFPVLVVVFIISFALISDYMYGKYMSTTN